MHAAVEHDGAAAHVDDEAAPPNVLAATWVGTAAHRKPRNVVAPSHCLCARSQGGRDTAGRRGGKG